MCGPIRHHKCPKCSMLLHKSIKHINNHICQKQYECEKCSKVYQYRTGLVKHQEICTEKSMLKTALKNLRFKKEEIMNENRLDFEGLKQDPLEIQSEFKTSENSFFVNGDSTNSFEFNSLKEFNKSKNKPIEIKEEEMLSEKSYESFNKPIFDEKNDSSEKNSIKEPVKKPIVVSMNDLNQDVSSMNSNPLKTQLHECSKCEFKTKIKSELKTHKMTIHAPSYKRYHPDPDRKFNCTSCDFRAKTEERLAKHTKIKHSGLKCHLCDFHYASTGSKEILHHLETVHSDVPTGAFKRLSNSTGTEENTTINNKQQQNKMLVTKINKQSFEDCISETKVSKKPIQVQIIEDSVQIDQCYMCGTKWKTNEIRSHFCYEHGRYPNSGIFHGPDERKDQCPKCKFFLAESIQDSNHVCIEYFARKAKSGEGLRNRDQQCSECGKVLKGHSLKKHMEYAHGTNDKLFECNKCNYKTKTARMLSKHTKFVHEKSRPYACDQCEKGFAQKWVMKNHIKAVHEGINPYKCENCGKGFNNPNSHERHKCQEYKIKVHEGKKPFECDRCDYCCSRKSDMNRHIASVHDPFECEICGYCCSHKSSMNRHVSAVHR